MRLIDADALIPIMKYTTTDNEIGVFPIRIGFDAIMGVIDEAPTIDAVEVVRCKDCCHRVHDEERGLYYCEMYYGQGDVSDKNFCQWGERREE